MLSKNGYFIGTYENSGFLYTSSNFLQHFKFSFWAYFCWWRWEKVVLKCSQSYVNEKYRYEWSFLNCLNRCFYSWFNARDCQYSNFRTTKIEFFLPPNLAKENLSDLANFNFNSMQWLSGLHSIISWKGEKALLWP